MERSLYHRRIRYVRYTFVDLVVHSIMHVYFATGSHVICKGSHTGSMGVSDHEEADTRMCIHIQDALQKGAKKILLRTVDTDVIVILAGHFFFYNQHII